MSLRFLSFRLFLFFFLGGEGLYKVTWIWLFFTGINTFSHTPSKEWFQVEAVLRVSLGNFLFFTIFALIMIGVKDQNDRRDSWHHGGWTVKIVIWVLLIALMFFLPNVVTSVYGKFTALRQSFVNSFFPTVSIHEHSHLQPRFLGYFFCYCSTNMSLYVNSF